MNAILKDPSAKSRRKRLGILKAAKKASDPGPAPRDQAIIMSLTNPSIRLMKVAAPIIPAALVTRFVSDMVVGNLSLQFTSQAFFELFPVDEYRRLKADNFNCQLQQKVISFFNKCRNHVFHFLFIRVDQ